MPKKKPQQDPMLAKALALTKKLELSEEDLLRSWPKLPTAEHKQALINALQWEVYQKWKHDPMHEQGGLYDDDIPNHLVSSGEAEGRGIGKKSSQRKYHRDRDPKTKQMNAELLGRALGVGLPPDYTNVIHAFLKSIDVRAPTFKAVARDVKGIGARRVGRAIDKAIEIGGLVDHAGDQKQIHKKVKAALARIDPTYDARCRRSIRAAMLPLPDGRMSPITQLCIFAGCDPVFLSWLCEQFEAREERAFIGSKPRADLAAGWLFALLLFEVRARNGGKLPRRPRKSDTAGPAEVAANLVYLTLPDAFRGSPGTTDKIQGRLEKRAGRLSKAEVKKAFLQARLMFEQILKSTDS